MPFQNAKVRIFFQTSKIHFVYFLTFFNNG